ncbi:MAG TPA: hypothetical protein PLO70_16095 [Chitinophagaceae bacterium]|nr:hypothetical protein [Chitinophagaceae bacterium]HQX73832.1 hypothetical protein [Chitinophagaceae bacterium]HQZ76043.1 hypothetical protein [Chitinophagaceae bacterium]
MKIRFITTALLPLLLFFSLLTISSCQKEDSQNGTVEEQEIEASKASSEADSEAEIVFNGIFDDAMGVNDEVGVGGTGVFGRLNVCPVVTVTRLNPPDLFPVRILMDFGTNGCIGPDGHFRKGKVITTYTNRLMIPGAIATTIFDGFYFDSTKVEGTHKITNTSATNIARRFTVNVIEAKLTKPNGNFIEWNSEKVITQLEGLSTPAPMDDIFKIEGGSRGRVKRGALLVGWQSTILEPLVKRFNCRWIVRGVIRTVRLNATTNSPWIAVLNFGNGNCDNLAVITINGVSYQITLP